MYMYILHEQMIKLRVCFHQLLTKKASFLVNSTAAYPANFMALPCAHLALNQLLKAYLLPLPDQSINLPSGKLTASFQ